MNCYLAEDVLMVKIIFYIFWKNIKIKASNECTDRSLNTCDESADCIDTQQGYSCRCIPGYVDVSTNANLNGLFV